jgi:chemotaxis protein MotB
MARKKKGGDHGGGGHGGAWVITFADLVSLLMAFFVMLLSFSIQDQQKLAIVSGSMKDAFGVRPFDPHFSGVIEVDGKPFLEHMRMMTPFETKEGTEFASEQKIEGDHQGPEIASHDAGMRQSRQSQEFALAAASLRQAWRELPDIADPSQSVTISETREGLDIEIVDEQGGSMFAQGSAQPNRRLRQLLTAMAPALAQLSNRIQISGHTALEQSQDQARKSNWQLSSERALAAYRILAENGIEESRFGAVIGKGDSEPLFPEDPLLAANRRISLVLLADAPPLSPNARP